MDSTKPPWEINSYVFTGPGIAIRCTVNYDKEQECYVATGGAGHVGADHSAQGAALACFEAWCTNRHAYYQQPSECGGEKR